MLASCAIQTAQSAVSCCGMTIRVGGRQGRGCPLRPCAAAAEGHCLFSRASCNCTAGRRIVEAAEGGDGGSISTSGITR